MVAASDQPSAVPMITPSTSPIAQPVRQCTVALKASALSDWVTWCVVMRSRLSDTPLGYEPEDRDPPSAGPTSCLPDEDVEPAAHAVAREAETLEQPARGAVGRLDPRGHAAHAGLRA